MFPTISLGPLSLPAPELILLVGIWLGISASEYFARRKGAGPDTPTSEAIYNLVFAALAAGIVGARLVYAARNLGAFLASPLSLFSLQPALFDPLGGLAASAAAAWVSGYRHKLSFWPTLDTLSPGLAVMATAIGLAHLASGEAYGVPTGLPWGLELWEARRHPTQVYEIIVGLAALAAVWPWRGQAWYPLPGMRFLTFASIASASQLFIAGLRAGGERAPFQAAMWVILALSLWALGRLLKAQAAASTDLE